VGGGSSPTYRGAEHSILPLSLALNEHYRWIDRIWSIALWILLLASVIYFIAQSIRRRSVAGTSGYPRWFLRFAYDDDERKEEGNPPNRKGPHGEIDRM